MFLAAKLEIVVTPIIVRKLKQIIQIENTKDYADMPIMLGGDFTIAGSTAITNISHIYTRDNLKHAYWSKVGVSWRRLQTNPDLQHIRCQTTCHKS